MIIKNKLYFCKIFSVSISVSIVSSLGLKSLRSCTLRSPNIFFIFLILIFILLTRRKAIQALIQRVSNYPDLLPKMPRYCCPLVI